MSSSKDVRKITDKDARLMARRGARALRRIIAKVRKRNGEGIPLSMRKEARDA